MVWRLMGINKLNTAVYKGQAGARQKSQPCLLVLFIWPVFSIWILLGCH